MMRICIYRFMETDGTKKKEILLAEMKKNGIDHGIVIADSESESEIGSTDECMKLFENCSNISVVAGISPYIDYRNRLRELERCCRENKIVGIKLYCGHEPIFIDDDVLKPVFMLAVKFHLPVLFHSGWENVQYAEPDRVKRVANAYPDICFICCHCFYPQLEKCFDILENCHNVFFDLSSVADCSDRNSLIKRVLEDRIPDMPDRFLFGSDYASCDQKRHLEFCRTLILSKENMNKLLYLNAEKVYRLP